VSELRHVCDTYKRCRNKQHREFYVQHDLVQSMLVSWSVLDSAVHPVTLVSELCHICDTLERCRDKQCREFYV